jgi:hypothetical protein
MRPDHCQQPTTRKPRTRLPGARLPLLWTLLIMLPFGAAALAANKPTAPGPKVPPSVPTSVLKPPVQSASTGSLKTSRQALLKERTGSITGLNNRHPGKIIGTTKPPPKMIVTKRNLPK